MATALTRKLFPGCTLRVGAKGRTIRFDAMIKGNRFVGTSQLPISMTIDPKGRPTNELKVEYAKWRSKQECESLGPDNVGLRIPSIQELIDAYEEVAWKRHNNPAHGDPAERTIEACIKNYRYCVEASGLAPSRPYTELFAVNMMRKIFTTFCSRKKDDGTIVKPVTAWSYLAALQSVASDWSIAMYYDLGLDVRQPNMKAVDVGRAKQSAAYKSLPAEQVDQIMMWYSTLEDKLGKECRLAALMSLKLAMRPDDVIKLTVDNFPVRNGKRYLSYEPGKTFARSGRAVCVAIAPALWEEIVQLAGEDIDTGARFIKSPRTTYSKLNQSIRYCCGMKREDGWDKATYELRKLCLDLIWHDPQQGPEVAVALSGDNRSTLEKYYTDPYTIDKPIGG